MEFKDRASDQLNAIGETENDLRNMIKIGTWTRQKLVIKINPSRLFEENYQKNVLWRQIGAPLHSIMGDGIFWALWQDTTTSVHLNSPQ